MRGPILALASVVACASREAAPPPNAVVVPIANVPPQPMQPMQPMQAPPPVQAKPTTLTGTVGGQRFVAQSALLVRVNESADSGSSVFPGQKFAITWSFLLIFDRVLGCDDVGRNMLPKSAVVDRFVKYQVQGRWPLAAGRTFALGLDPQQPAADGFSGGIWRGSSGSNLRGTVRVVDATTLEMDVTTATSGADTSGALRGTVAVTVCR